MLGWAIVYSQDNITPPQLAVNYPDSIEGLNFTTSSFGQTGLNGLAFRKFRKEASKAIARRTYPCEEKSFRKMFSNLTNIKKFKLYNVNISVDAYIPNALIFKFNYQ
jgi:hypothetical protein